MKFVTLSSAALVLLASLTACGSRIRCPVHSEQGEAASFKKSLESALEDALSIEEAIRTYETRIGRWPKSIADLKRTTGHSLGSRKSVRLDPSDDRTLHVTVSGPNESVNFTMQPCSDAVRRLTQNEVDAVLKNIREQEQGRNRAKSNIED